MTVFFLAAPSTELCIGLAGCQRGRLACGHSQSLTVMTNNNNNVCNANYCCGAASGTASLEPALQGAVGAGDLQGHPAQSIVCQQISLGVLREHC